MRILVAPDSFKGSLSAAAATEAIASGLHGHEIDRCPLSDGGEGFLDTLLAASGGERRHAEVTDALGRPITASYGILDEETVVVELSSAASLAQLTDDERNPLQTSTYGVGELIARAWEETHFHRLLLSLGGSATVDGGAGLLEALGVRLLDSEGRPIPRGGGGLLHLDHIDAAARSPALNAEIMVAVDVRNPLLGPRGAARVYGPQKGATPEMVEQLEAGLSRWADALPREVRELPGTGAAGGVLAGLLAFSHATAVPGFSLVAQAVGLAERIGRADAIITGEGQLDEQSFEGKVVGSLASMRHGKPLVALVGSATPEGKQRLTDQGGACFSLVPGPVTLAEAQANASAWLRDAARQVGVLLRPPASP